MPKVANKEYDMVEILQSSHKNAEKLGKFLSKVRTPLNDMSGKWNVKKHTLDALFNDNCWIKESIAKGHNKYKHLITGIYIEYKAHDDELLGPGAAEGLALELQKHISKLYEEAFDCQVRNRPGTQLNPHGKINFEKCARRLENNDNN